jgi:hypothetical protein
MALFGRRISAERAHAAGFAAEISDDPYATAFEIAESLANRSSQAVEVAKYMIHAAAGEDRNAMVEALGAAMIGPTEDRRRRRHRLSRKAQTEISGKIVMNDLNVVSISEAKLPGEAFTARHLIDGEWRDSADGATFERVSPSHGVVSHPRRQGRSGGDRTRRLRLRARRLMPARWSRQVGQGRATLLLKVADLIDRERERIALIETLESGKPISQAQAEIEGAADLWRYAASLARTSMATATIRSATTCWGRSEGTDRRVSMITPWNFPFLIFSQKLPFALAAGCTAVVKPSE